MALQASGAISFSELRDDFFSSGSVSLSDYYKGGGIVEAGQQGVNVDIPASGALSLSDFYGGVGLHILDNPNPYAISASDTFGWSSAIDGNYAIVGAPYETESYTKQGVVYIFNATTGQLIHTIDNPNPVSGGNIYDAFGTSVAISGNYAIVGASSEDDAEADSGKAYIFNVTTGALVHTLDNPSGYSTGGGDNFGTSVAISGNYAIVGAPFEDQSLSPSSGKAYIFNVTTGALVHTLNNPNAYGSPQEDYFGYWVAIDGNYAIVGAPYEDDATVVQSGKAYVFNVSTGSLLYTLDNPNPDGTANSDFFARAVAISGNYAIVSARDEEDTNGIYSGKAYIFNVTTGALIYTLDNPNPFGTSDFDSFGYSVAMSGNYAIVSANSEDEAGSTNSGKAYVYKTENGNWSDTALVKTLDNPNDYGTSQNDRFGFSVSVSNGIAISSTYYEDDASGTSVGKAYIFNLANL